MRSVVSGVAGSVRLKQLTAATLTIAERHGKRLDRTSKFRAIRDARALTRTGLNLNAQYDKHVRKGEQGNEVFIPKAKTKALHVMVQFPKDLVDPVHAADMLDHARAFCETVFGTEAIFADRIDRDEKNEHVVDVFVAPRYRKRTKTSDKDAVSMTRHLKNLAIKRGYPPIPPAIGRALQDELFEYLRDIMKLDGVERGAKKAFAGPDWKSAEQQRLEELEGIEKMLENERERVREAMAAVAQQRAALKIMRVEVVAERERILTAAAEERERLLGEGERIRKDAVAIGEAEKVRLESAGELARQSAVAEGRAALLRFEEQAVRSRDETRADEIAAAKKLREAEDDRLKAREAREMADANFAKAQQVRQLAEASSREAAARVVEARKGQEKVSLDEGRMKLLARVVDPEDELFAIVREDGIRFRGPLSDEEKSVIKSGFGEMRQVWYSILPKLIAMDAREWELSQRDYAELKKSQADFEKERGAWRRTLDRAFVFLEAWREVPAEERAPSIQKTFLRATELTKLSMPDLATDEIPPGYSLPGKGSHEMG